MFYCVNICAKRLVHTTPYYLEIIMLPSKMNTSVLTVVIIKLIIVAAAIIFLPIGDFLMCSCFVLPPSYLTTREIRPGFNRFTALFVCNGVVGACMAAALALGIEIEGVSVGMMFITCAIYTFLFGVPLDALDFKRHSQDRPQEPLETHIENKRDASVIYDAEIVEETNDENGKRLQP